MTNGMMLLAMGHALHIWSTILPPMNSYARWNKVTKIWKILSSISSWVNAWHVGRETKGIMKKKVMWPIYPLGSTVGTLYKPVRHYICVSTMFFICSCWCHSMEQNDDFFLYISHVFTGLKRENLDFSFLALGTRGNSNKPQNNHKKKIVTCFCYVCVHSTTIYGQYKHWSCPGSIFNCL